MENRTIDRFYDFVAITKGSQATKQALVKEKIINKTPQIRTKITYRKEKGVWEMNKKNIKLT